MHFYPGDFDAFWRRRWQISCFPQNRSCPKRNGGLRKSSSLTAGNRNGIFVSIIEEGAVCSINKA